MIFVAVDVFYASSVTIEIVPVVQSPGAVLGILAAILHVPVWRTRAALCTFAAVMVYIGGGLLLTMNINVPMNEWLASLGPASGVAEPVAARARYEAAWVFWNPVRAVCSTVAFLLGAAALWFDGRGERLM